MRYEVQATNCGWCVIEKDYWEEFGTKKEAQKRCDELNGELDAKADAVYEQVKDDMFYKDQYGT